MPRLWQWERPEGFVVTWSSISVKRPSAFGNNLRWRRGSSTSRPIAPTRHFLSEGTCFLDHIAYPLVLLPMKFLRAVSLPSLALTLEIISFGHPTYAQNSFLSETLVRKDQVQNVLDYQPATAPSCKNAVVSPSSFAYVCCWGLWPLLVDWSDRNYTLRLWVNRKCKRWPIQQPLRPCPYAVLPVLSSAFKYCQSQYPLLMLV